MDNTENRFKIKLPVAENPLAQKLLGNILKVNDAKLAVPAKIFAIGDDGNPLVVAGTPKQDKVARKPRGTSDQGWCED